MAQAKKKTSPSRKKTTSAAKKPAASAKTAPSRTERKPVRRGIGALVCVLLAVFSLIGFSSSDAVFIALFRSAARGLAGSGFAALPVLLLVCAVTLCFHRGRPVAFRVTCTLLLTIVVATMTHLFACKLMYELTPGIARELWADGQFGVHGGLLGGFLAVTSEKLFSKSGAAIVFIIIGLFLAISATGRTLVEIIDAYKNRPKREYEPIPEPVRSDKPIEKPVKAPRPQVDLRMEPESTPYAFHEPEADPVTVLDDARDEVAMDIPFMERNPAPVKPVKRAKSVKPQAETAPEPDLPEHSESHATPVAPEEGEYIFPPLHLLTQGGAARSDGAEEIRMNTELLEQAFRDFGVAAHIVKVMRGPSVTRYEAELKAGVKLSSITKLTEDLALALGASGIRIGAMPNRISTVGIEVPNQSVSMVYLRSIIESPEFRDAPGKLTFAIGKNIPGDSIVDNIAKLTHLLVAGTTGSGKSVCLNSLILSILYKATPDEVRFIMIDPKMVEFRIYNGIPHLLVPVVTDVKKASGALQWAVIEMERRYKYFSERNSRDLESYNRVITQDGEKLMPQIVIIIDELADLMMTSRKEVEDSVIRIAQKGRAAGIHLVIATQTPRKDVITGIMKANLPSRIALKVASALESRIILEAGHAADKLVGNGDLLFKPQNTSNPVRVQGAYVTDEEREAVVNFIKRGGDASYSDDVINEIERASMTSEKDEKNRRDDSEQPDRYDFDELLPQAADVIFDTGQASTSMLQRRLRLGYARASRIIDQLETLGMLGPFEGSKARQVLITREQWKRTKHGGGGGAAAPAPEEEDYDDEDDFDDEDDDPPWLE